jgi:hypothetical protein
MYLRTVGRYMLSDLLYGFLNIGEQDEFLKILSAISAVHDIV